MWRSLPNVVGVVAATSCFSCSRPSAVEVELDPMPHAERMHVEFPAWPDGVPHDVTDPNIVGRVESLVNARRGGWYDVVRYHGKAPIAHADVTWYSANITLHLKVGDGWLMRDSLLQDVPRERSREIMGLLGGTMR
jgi:hypothetical protein